MAAAGVRKIPLHQDSEYFGRLSVEDRHLRAVTDARESVVPLSARAAFASLRRRATGLCEAEIYFGDVALRRLAPQDMSPLTLAGASAAAAAAAATAAILKAPGQHPLPLAIKTFHA